MSGARVRLAGVEVELGGALRLGPLDLDVAPGERLLVTGPSGSGKTTLLRAIAGLARLRAGTVELDGRVASRGPRLAIPPERREIGFVFQGGALWPHLSPRRTVAFVLARRGVRGRAARARTQELLAAVRLAGLEDRAPATLSGGERQRLALARALAGDPRILLLDEPLGPLDRELRRELVATLDELLLAREMTVLHVTHDPDEVRADRRIELAAGRLAPPEVRT